MKAIMIMFDSLNRHMLPPYGCDWVIAPNFQRLAEHTVTFDNSYIGSMPCMPARREIHTGRYNFLHRSWGPLEPFDDSMPELLSQAGIHTHLVSDHYHYWEDGGATYHQRYDTWESVRGQEGDKWMGVVAPPAVPEYLGQYRAQDLINRQFMPREEDQPQAKTFKKGIEFITRNYQDDNWFLQIETFDPHEPYFTQQHYKDLYNKDYDGPLFDWPEYRPVNEEERPYVDHVRRENAALITMCDHYLGQVLDMMDHHHMWEDTLLIVNTDHGFLLGEHDWWAKSTPYYGEIAHTPLFIWDPRLQVKNEHRTSLIQTIDLAPTLLDYFGVTIPEDMEGKSASPIIERDTPIHKAVLFGSHGSEVNCTDGRYVYMRAPKPDNLPLYEYTLMPTHMRGFFSTEELQDIQLQEPFPFTKGCRTMKVEGRGKKLRYPYTTKLYDLKEDPEQNTPIEDPQVEARMIAHMKELMEANDAPKEQYVRLGLSQ